MIQAQAQEPHNKWEYKANEMEKRYTKSLQAVSDLSESLSTGFSRIGHDSVTSANISKVHFCHRLQHVTPI